MSQGESIVFSMSLQRLIYKLIKTYELCDRMCLAQQGVTVSQGYTLLTLPQEGKVSMNELSEAMELANSTITRMVDQLVHKGLAYRSHDDEDRRVVRVGLTAQGQQLRRTLERAQQDCFQTVLDEIREDDRHIVLQALEQVTRSLANALRVCCDDRS